jgi:hypothetical protein
VNVPAIISRECGNFPKNSGPITAKWPEIRKRAKMTRRWIKERGKFILAGKD